MKSQTKQPGGSLDAQAHRASTFPGPSAEAGRVMAGHHTLVEEPLPREGLLLKLERGFDPGIYCVYVHFDDLASRVGYVPARRRAEEFCRLLANQLDRFAGHSSGEIKYAAGIDVFEPRRQSETMVVGFDTLRADGRYRDKVMMDHFRLAVVRAGQEWDQRQAQGGTQRQDAKRDSFRRQLDTLLGGDAYRHLDVDTRVRLLEEVPPMAFPARGHEL
jgi:hypothetical protein